MNQAFTLKKLIQPPGLIVLLWAVLVAMDGWVRPLFPSNEMHHASIAWEMYSHHQFLVPTQSGLPYAEKPPLLYWLINLGWFLFGVNSVWIRLLPQLFMLGALLLTRALARRLVPEEQSVAVLAPLILLGSLAWSLQMHITWFDMTILFFSLLCWYLLHLAVQQSRYLNWLFFGLAMGGGILAKGPVIFIFALSPAIFMRWWGMARNSWRQSYWQCAAAILLAVVIGLTWAIPAAIQGGSQYSYDLFLMQSAGRITGQHGPEGRWYLYLLILPLLLFPWIIWAQPWRAAIAYYRSRQNKHTACWYFLAAGILIPLLTLSLFATKSSGYLFPCLPLIAIALAYLFVLDSQPSSRRGRILIAVLYCGAGLIYLSVYFGFSHLVPLKIQNHFFWLNELSWIYGFAWLLIGIFWLIWNERECLSVALGISLTTISFVLLFQMGINKVIAVHNDWRPLASQIRKLQEENIPVAFPKSNAEELFEFFGRLKQPTVIKPEEIPEWIKNHPNGWLIVSNHAVSPTQYRLIPAGEFRKI